MESARIRQYNEIRIWDNDRTILRQHEKTQGYATKMLRQTMMNDGSTGTILWKRLELEELHFGLTLLSAAA